MSGDCLQTLETKDQNIHQAALFWDRDGVINFDYGYVHSKHDFEFIPGIFQLVKCAKKKGYKAIIITNQSGIGRGYYSDENFWDLMDWVRDAFKHHHTAIDDIYYCPDLPSECDETNFFRKPNPGMIFRAAVDHNLSLRHSILVGDNLSDIEAGKAAGIVQNILFRSDGCDDSYCEKFCVDNLSEIITFL